MSVLIVTSVGDIVIDLHTDRCPLTTKNFLKLCKIKYYNGCLFHKVEKDFLAQTGDRTGTGTGGDSIYKLLYGEQARFFEDEIRPDLKHSRTGTVAMASAGENLNASQFYFTLRDDLDYLDGKHTVFGVVEEQESLDTLIKINEAYVDNNGRPFKDIRIKHTYILDDPFEDPPQISEFIPESSPEGKPPDEIAEERLEDNWVALDETLGPQELEERLRTKEAQTNAAILESIGDIPDADIKPPDNVLFVCKLNPVTQDEDLYTIFSRFGNVTSADVIRDYKTGDSLCYAFIEFETNEACERAFFKMDNALIDDRRIHVDFSQSVARMWSRYHRHGKRTDEKKDGCFKCGAPGHIARNCDKDPGNNHNAPKYVLKDDNTQHGGQDHREYDMVFDEGNLNSENHKGNTEKAKRQKTDDHERERPGDGRKTSDKRRPEDYAVRHSRDHDRSRESWKHDEYRRSKNDGRSTERYEDREHRRRHDGSSKYGTDDRTRSRSSSGQQEKVRVDGDRHLKDEREHRKRTYGELNLKDGHRSHRDVDDDRVQDRKYRDKEDTHHKERSYKDEKKR